MTQQTKSADSALLTVDLVMKILPISRDRLKDHLYFYILYYHIEKMSINIPKNIDKNQSTSTLLFWYLRTKKTVRMHRFIDLLRYQIPLHRA